jgi:hypothetical protein
MPIKKKIRASFHARADVAEAELQGPRPVQR